MTTSEMDMETTVDRLVQELSAGFGALQDEYHQLYFQHQALERKLATAREQYNELAKLYNPEQTATPPLSLSSSPGQLSQDVFEPRTVADILDTRPDIHAKDSANKVRAAIVASGQLKGRIPLDTAAHGVKIWSGPSADRPGPEGSSSMMPSISESPLEQDFTVEGKPSQLGCPFATMAKKKLSSHAASVLSRYERNGPTGSVTASTPVSHTSHVNGRDNFSRRSSRRASMVDPIKAEICGLSDHNTSPVVSPVAEKAPSKGPTELQIENAEVGVCPIRFLDQHSPEEVATYFEKHKNELPRSHEVCILRYQSNEEQIKQLDAKYGNLVSMIQGLGQRHKEMLPEEPEADEQDAERHDDAVSEEKIRKWASSVSAQAPEAGAVEDDSEERLPHFERPVREIRVGESPSRPWGIPVPAKYFDKAASEASSQPVQVATPKVDLPIQQVEETKVHAQKPTGKCPFDHNALKAMGMSRPKPVEEQLAANKAELKSPDGPPAKSGKPQEKSKEQVEAAAQASASTPQIVINGPVFIGYSPEDAIRVLRETGIKIN